MKFLKDLFSKVPKELPGIQLQRSKMVISFAEHVLGHKEDYGKDVINEATNVVLTDFYAEFERMMG